jgi:RNA polymerase sigma-70 factor (ECF subfamily)
MRRPDSTAGLPPRVETDAELVRRVLRGEREHYEALVGRYQDELYRHARGMGIDHDAAEDLVQDAFIKAYIGLGECRDPARFRSWVYRILSNLCLDYLKNIRRRSVPLEVLENESGAACSLSEELRMALARALAGLTADLREAFLLKHQAGYRYEEMAEILDASVSAVKMRVHRAREQLRAALVETGYAGR